MSREIENHPVSPSPPTPVPAGACENCGAPLYGKFCYACGQPTAGLVRGFGSVVGDVADSVLNVDERLFKTLVPLYLHPGKLTLDYFAGKRARYVAPFRLVFFLVVVAFFAMQLGVRGSENHLPVVAINSSGMHEGTLATLPKEPDTHFAGDQIKFNGRVFWNGQTKPLQIRWLPDIANAWLNGLIGNARGNLHRMNSGNPLEIRNEARHMMAGMFSAAPTVLFLLLPVFALLLKLFYLFKRRLYMEHLIFAMHSHAFLMLSMLVMLTISTARNLLAPHIGGFAGLLTVLLDAAWLWIFVYLFLMQKRVYQQGWWMTAVKFFCVGCCYACLAGLGMALAFLASLTGA